MDVEGFPAKGPSRMVFRTESDAVALCYSVVNLLRVVSHYSKHSKSVQTLVFHCSFSSESLRVVNSLQIVNSRRILFLVCRGPLGCEIVRFGYPNPGKCNARKCSPKNSRQTSRHPWQRKTEKKFTLHFCRAVALT